MGVPPPAGLGSVFSAAAASCVRISWALCAEVQRNFRLLRWKGSSLQQRAEEQ